MILSSVTLFLFIMSLLYIIREIVRIVNCFRLIKKYQISNINLIILWITASYIITFLII